MNGSNWVTGTSVDPIKDSDNDDIKIKAVASNEDTNMPLETARASVFVNLPAELHHPPSGSMSPDFEEIPIPGSTTTYYFHHAHIENDNHVVVWARYVSGDYALYHRMKRQVKVE